MPVSYATNPTPLHFAPTADDKSCITEQLISTTG
jgi:hypothetical protein